MTTLSLIVAMDENGTIGKGDGLPWSLPRDLRHFREKTTGHPIIMGRKTFDTLGRPLPRRKNIVLSREPVHLEGCTVVTSLEELFREVKDETEAFVIGGKQVYELLFPYVDTCHVTRVVGCFEGDTHLSLDLSDFDETSSRYVEKDEETRHDLSFHVYKRKPS